MTEHRDFDAEPTEDRSSTFTLGGESFTTVPDLPMQAYRALGGEGVIVTEKAAEFIRRCLVMEDRERWDALVADDARPISAPKVADVFQWLSQRYGERPTEPSSA